LASAKTFLIS